MFEKLQKKLKQLIKIKPRGGSLGAGNSDDDDLLKELGLDDMSLLEDSDKAREKSVDYVMDDAVSKKKEKSLLTLSYVALGLIIVVGVSASTILLLSSYNQSKIKDEIVEQKISLQTKLDELQKVEIKDINTIEIEVDSNKFYTALYTNRLKASEIIDIADDVIDQVRTEENAFIKESKMTIRTKENLITLDGITNSYTSLGKIIKVYNQNEIFSPVVVNGATKTITADGVAEVPYNFSLDIIALEDTTNTDQNVQK